VGKGEKRAANRASRTSAHESGATVAPFRAWRGSQRIVARGPTRFTIELWFGLKSIEAVNELRIMLDNDDGFKR
jgi:hypothetical protein